MDQDRWASIAVATIIAVIVTLAILAVPKRALGGEKMMCSLEPQSRGEWHYRTKIPPLQEERCYYLGPRMKPRSELYWGEAPAIAPASVMAPEPEPPRWEQEHRFHPGASPGWNHKE